MSLATMPFLDDLAGDNAEGRNLPDGGYLRPNLMARSGTLMGFDDTDAVWRFGILPGSESAHAYGVEMPELEDEYGFEWVIATRRTAKVKQRWRGYALELPEEYRRIMGANGV